ITEMASAIGVAAREGRAYFKVAELKLLERARAGVVESVQDWPAGKGIIEQRGGAKKLLARFHDEASPGADLDWRLVSELKDLLAAQSLIDMLLEHGPGPDGHAAALLEACLLRQLDFWRRKAARVGGEKVKREKSKDYGFTKDAVQQYALELRAKGVA